MWFFFFFEFYMCHVTDPIVFYEHGPEVLVSQTKDLGQIIQCSHCCWQDRRRIYRYPDCYRRFTTCSQVSKEQEPFSTHHCICCFTAGADGKDSKNWRRLMWRWGRIFRRGRKTIFFEVVCVPSTIWKPYLLDICYLGTMMYLDPRNREHSGVCGLYITMWRRFVTVHWHISLLNVSSNSIVSFYSHPRCPLWRHTTELSFTPLPPYRPRLQTAAASLFQQRNRFHWNIRHIITQLPQRPIRQTHMLYWRVCIIGHCMTDWIDVDVEAKNVRCIWKTFSTSFDLIEMPTMHWTQK